MNKVLIEEASDEQLKAFAKTVLQLEDAETAKSRGDLLGMISVAWPNDYILADTDHTQAEQTEAVVHQIGQSVGGMGDRDPKMIIIIGETMLPGGKEPVPVAVNGRTVVLQRNINVEVPWRFYLAMADSTHTEVSQDQTTKEIVETVQQRFPHRVVKQPSEAEIAEWRARTDHEFAPA